MVLFEEDWRIKWQAAMQTAYPDVFIDELLRRHEVEPAIPVTDVAEFIRFSGANYLQQKSTEDTPAARKSREKPIREILSSAEKLASQIRALAPSAEAAFWRPLRYGDFELLAAVDTGAAPENNVTQIQTVEATSETTAFDNPAATLAI